MIRYIDLFSGVGGFRYGIDQAYCRMEAQRKADLGIRSEAVEGKHDTRTRVSLPQRHSGLFGNSSCTKCVYSNEWDKYANSVYRKHYGECDNRDIREVAAEEIPSFDLLCSGFPCQAFSIAGKRKGFEDIRGTLFFDIARIVKHHQPRFLLLENVKGLVSHDKGKTLEVILETLQELGYYVNWDIYNSKDYGVPQNRERIIFICKHIREIISVGQNQKITSSEKIIQDYLFQLLLNNLVEVRKLQETKSKDWVVGYLLLKEMNQSLKSSEKNTKDGILMDMEESKSLSTEELWQNIGLFLKNHWEENYLGKNKYTISTAIKEIIDWKTYTFSKMSLAIYTLTDQLRNSQKNLWNEILSGLIVIKENTKYARLNNQKEKGIVSENGTTYESRDIQGTEENISERHLRGTRRPEVFPIIGSNKKDIEQVNNPKHSNNRIFLDSGIAPTINTMQGGNRQPKIINPLKGKTDYGWHFEQNVYSDSSITRALKSSEGSGNKAKLLDGVSIRRLTPIECERLQSFPDNFTQYGHDGKEISDSQRYKMMGNAVTTNVVTAIIERLLK